MDPILNPFDYFTIPFGKWAEMLLNIIVSNSRETLLAAKVPVQSFLQLIQSGLMSVPPLIGIVVAAFAGYWLSGWRLALVGIFCLTAIGLIGAWQAAMITLSIVIAAVTICVIVGMPIGIFAARSDRFFKITCGSN